MLHLSVCAHDQIVMKAKKDKTTLHLSVNPKLKRLMKMHCASEGTNVSSVTESLYTDFLDRQKHKPRGGAHGPTNRVQDALR